MKNLYKKLSVLFLGAAAIILLFGGISSAEEKNVTIDPLLYKNLKYRFIGPPGEGV